MSEKVTAKDVLAAIFARHEGEEWVRFAEVANSTGTHARRRADAICMNIWPSRGYALHGFEIKVSRSDFIHEMKDITKAEAVAQFCDFWWLAAPVGLIKPDEVPATWGLMELQKNGLKIKKQAPQREAPQAVTRGFMAAMLRKSRDADNAYIRTQLDALREKQEAAIKQDVEFRRSAAEEKSAKNEEWIRRFEEALGIQFSAWTPPEKIAARLRIAETLDGRSVEQLKRACALLIENADAMTGEADE